MASASSSAPCSQQYGSRMHRPIVLGDNVEEEEEEKARELAVQTFYLEEDEYDDLHQRWYRTCKEDRECMQSEGLTWKRGRWSVQEIRLLKRNVKAFMKEHGIKDIAHFITSDKSTKRDKQFYQYIGKGLQRPLFNIYKKVVLVFNLQNYIGKWTEEMDKELLRLHKIHGNKWVEIGKHIGTTGRAVLDRFRKISNRKKVGCWSESEERKLREAMEEVQREHGGGESDDLPSTVRWKDIAARVGTRTEIQCLEKWILTLSWKLSPHKNIQWTISDDLKLIHSLASLEVEDEEEVDWKELCRDWPAAHNVCCLRKRWASVRRDVPHYHVQTMQENLEYLMSNKVPALEKHCKE